MKRVTDAGHSTADPRDGRRGKDHGRADVCQSSRTRPVGAVGDRRIGRTSTTPAYGATSPAVLSIIGAVIQPPATGTPAVDVRGVVKRFGDTTALDGVDLVVSEGQVVGLLGPNGAGKTTLVRVLATLLKPTDGTASVFGHDVVREAAAVRQIIGLTGQYAAVDEVLTGRENLQMFGELFHMPRRAAAERADELLHRFDLADAADRSAGTYSGGMRRRLDLASSLLVEPRLLFLDEPTTGLDPRSRNEIWDVIRELVDRGTTLLLTTQYLEEADVLADEIAVIDAGRIIAKGTGDELKENLGGQMIEVLLTAADDHDKALEILHRAGCGDGPDRSPDGRRLRMPAPDGDGVGLLAEVARAMADAGISIRDIGLRRPTLDDVFLELTGARARPGRTEGGGAAGADRSDQEVTR